MKKTLTHFFSKEEKLRAKGKRIFGMTLTSPNFPPPPMQKRIQNLYKFSFPYFPSGGDFELKRIFAKNYSARWKAKLKEENVFIGNGGKEIIFILLQILLSKGGEAIIVSPYWPSYPRMIKMAKSKTKIFKTSEKDGFYIDVKKLEKEISSRTKVLILNTPCNPTGRILKEEEVKYLARLALKKNFILIADEVYEAYDYENRYCSFLKFFNKNIFCIFSASKSFSLCGWRLGWGFGDKNLIEEMKFYQGDLSTSPHSLSQLVIKDIFKDSKGVSFHFEKAKKETMKKRDFIVSFFEINKINFVLPEGGIAIFVKIPKSFKDSFSFCDKLLEAERVAIAPGKIFGEDKYFRLNIAISLDDLKEIAKRLKKYY